jgi:ferrous iron transport protein B
MPNRSLTVALVGNPNTGKSTLFNALTGLRQHVGNYPGVTVELKNGTAAAGDVTLRIVDLPGTYSLAARSPDEMVTVDFILGHKEERPDVVISIVDASNLERHLYLTSQLMGLSVPLILAVNLIDVADKQKLKIDFERISKQLGIPVVPIQANKGKGLEDLKRIAVATAAERKNAEGPVFPPAFQAVVAGLQHELPGVEPFLVQRLVIDVDGHIERSLGSRFGPGLAEKIQAARKQLAVQGYGVPAVEAKTRYGWIRQALSGCIQRPAAKLVTLSDRFDRLLTHKVFGTLIFLSLMFVVFEAIFIWAQPLMSWIDSVRETFGDAVRDQMAPGVLRSLLTDGVLKGVGSVLVFLPQIMILFGFIAVLEDCGYMARAAFLMDKIMAKCGLNGKSFIPMLSSVACAVPGIMATRVIDNRRDRLATILVAPLMSCSARLPLYMLLIGVFLSHPWWLPGVALFGMYLIGLVVAPLVALVLKRTLLRGATPLFVMEMPAFKWPQAKTVVRRMTGAGWAFTRRAGTMILASMILIWALLYFTSGGPEGGKFYEVQTELMRKEIEAVEGQVKKLEQQDPKPVDRIKELSKELDDKRERHGMAYGDWKRHSLLGQAGKAMEPVFAPLGWDWRIGMAALASFPAREVIVGTLGIIYNQGDVDPKSIRDADNAADTPLGKAIRKEWDDEKDSPRAKYPRLVALSLLVFFALCCQCVSTLAVIRRETHSWWWPLFTFIYMTVLAYLGALVVFQVGRLIVQ